MAYFNVLVIIYWRQFKNYGNIPEISIEINLWKYSIITSFVLGLVLVVIENYFYVNFILWNILACVQLLCISISFQFYEMSELSSDLLFDWLVPHLIIY